MSEKEFHERKQEGDPVFCMLKLIAPTVATLSSKHFFEAGLRYGVEGDTSGGSFDVVDVMRLKQCVDSERVQ